jgi:hypothetical protein
VQSETATANLVNAARADVANGNNILAGNAGSLIGLQSNHVSQSETHIGYLNSSSLLGENVEATYAHSTSNSAYSRSAVTALSMNMVNSHVEISGAYTAIVPKYNPLADLTLPLGKFTLGNKDLGIKSIGTGIAHNDTGDYGIDGSIGRVVVLGPSIDLGSLQLTGKDIVINTGSVTLPGVDFGTAQLKACFVDCVSTGPLTIGKVGGTVLNSPLGTLRFAGANPFGAMDLSLNTGFSAAGSGELRFNGGAVTIEASTTLSLPGLKDLGTSKVTLPITKAIQDIAKSLGVDAGSFSLNIPNFSIPDLTLTVKLDSTATSSSVSTSSSANAIGLTATLPLSGGLSGFNIDLKFDGAFCMDVANQCKADGSTTKTSITTQDNSFAIAGQSESGSSTSSADSGSKRVVLGGNFEGASGRYIVVSDAAFAGTDGSDVALANGAQSNIKALNAVNAAGTIVGNGLNISAVPTAVNSIAGNTRLTQENVLVQHR